jgi:hypothetical protein
MGVCYSAFAGWTEKTGEPGTEGAWECRLAVDEFSGSYYRQAIVKRFSYTVGAIKPGRGSGQTSVAYLSGARPAPSDRLVLSFFPR